MLIEFQVTNYKSFRDKQVFSMVASSDQTLLDNTVAVDALHHRRLLRSAVIYGANASGKSNLVKAISFAAGFIRNSADRTPNRDISVQPFRLSRETEQAPSEFEFSFIHSDVRFQYGFSVDRKRVHEEWLIAYPKGLPQKWFERISHSKSEETEWIFGPNLKGEKKRIVPLTRPDVLFLSVAAKFGHDQLSTVYDWFQTHLGIISDDDSIDFLETITAQRVKEDKVLHAQIKELIRLADLGIVDFSVEERPYTRDDFPPSFPEELISVIVQAEKVDIHLRHSAEEDAESGTRFSIEDESLGTRRLFGISVPLFLALRRGAPLIVDELDASMHPVLVRAIVNLFHDPSINRENAQLIFNTHDTALLDASLFRRDQVWFVEKDTTGSSQLYPLLDFSPRKGEALQKGYLKGRYGAIPFIDITAGSIVANAEG